MLFIVDHDTEANLNQVVMFVPDDHDWKRVRTVCQECGIERPNILAIIDMPEPQILRTHGHIDEYAPYSR